MILTGGPDSLAPAEPCLTYPSTDVPRIIREDRGAVSSVHVPHNVIVASASVLLSLDGDSLRDLDVVLLPPDGSAARAIPVSGRKITARVEGEHAAGLWTLVVKGRGNGVSLLGWSLTLCEPPPPLACSEGRSPVTILGSDFETDNGAFTAPDGGWEWFAGDGDSGDTAARSVRPCRGSGCWKLLPEVQSQLVAAPELHSPIVDLTNVTGPIRLTWGQRHRLAEVHGDRGGALIVEVREYAGENHTSLEGVRPLPTARSDAHAPSPAGARLATSVGWGAMDMDLGSWRGRRIELVFRAKRDTVVTELALDDLQLTICSCTPEDCDDGNPCTTDVCDLQDMCVHSPLSDGTSCDDGNPCTSEETCEAGSCSGTPLPDGTLCSDGNACTTYDVCLAGQCQGEPLSCDDVNICTLDTCDPLSGCWNTPLTCDDGNLCTDGACDRDSGCVQTPNSASCDDEDPCTTGDTCSSGSCVGGPPSNCDDSNPCTDDECCPTSGCIHVDNTAPCDDGDACTTDDACSAGSCAGGPPLDCGDGFSCTSETCDPSSGCVYTDTLASCDDGNACTTGDSCEAGACVSGTSRDCDDGNECTEDSCDAASGCVHDPVAGECDDGDACTTDDQCSGGACVGGSAPDCDDLDPCTDDACDPALGCVHTENSAPCTDGDPCTTGDRCSGGTCLAPSLVDCDDGNVCTYDFCGCIEDDCTPASGCVHQLNTASCEDGDACTGNDTCAGGTCAGTPIPSAEVNDTVTLTTGSGTTTIAWSDAPGPFNLYRGARGEADPWSYNHACLQSMVAGTSADDAVTPSPGGFFYYLVSRGGPCAESIPGRASDGTPIPNGSPCAILEQRADNMAAGHEEVGR